MLKSFAIVSLVASAALAQTPPVVPAGISSGCSSFLNDLNKDANLKKCLSALTTATADYQSSNNATSSPSDTKVTSTLGKLCAPSVDDSCPEGPIRELIQKFYPACQEELTSKRNEEVVKNYDFLYSALPMRTAACSQDDTGNYCATQTKLPANQTPAQMQQVLSTSNNSPNTTTFKVYNVPFILIQPAASAEELCKPCTRKVLTAYMNFEAKVPYAPGVDNSAILGNQLEIYKNIQDKCPPNFLNQGGVQAAGGLGNNGPLAGGAVQIVASASQAFLVAGMGLLSLFALSAF